MDIPAILEDIFPGAVWSLEGDDYSGLEWDPSNVDPKPSEDFLLSEWPRVEWENRVAEISLDRHAAYSAPDGPDAVFLEWQRGDASEQEWLNAVRAVKEAYPYPEQP